MKSDDECEIVDVVVCKNTLPSQVSILDQSKTTPDLVQQFTCPMCPYISGEISDLEAHVEDEHLNPTVTILRLFGSFIKLFLIFIF